MVALPVLCGCLCGCAPIEIGSRHDAASKHLLVDASMPTSTPMSASKASLNWKQVPVEKPIAKEEKVVSSKHIQPKLRYPTPLLIVTPEVTREIKHFTEQHRKYIVKSYNNRANLFDELVELFEREGMPLELLNVAVIESAYEPKAVSPSGAAGIWQFMKATGRHYGLNINFFRDERKDPVRSTWAAVRHLRDLYEDFDDWYLALAAYNAGAGAVSRAIKKGGTRDYWTLSRKGYLTKQTAQYVPRFIAVTIIMQNLREYGFVEMAGELHVDHRRLG